MVDLESESAVRVISLHELVEKLLVYFLQMKTIQKRVLSSRLEFV
jgi:hypothetical protein